MKYSIVFFWLFGSLSSLVRGQVDPLKPSTEKVSRDTVYVTNVSSTYLIFPDEVEFCDVGAPDSYMQKIEGKTVFIRSSTCDARPTTLLIKYGDKYLYGVLVAKVNPAKTMYNYENKDNSAEKAKVELEKKKLIEENERKKLQESITKKLEMLKAEKDHYKTLGLYQDGLFFQVTVIKNDNQCCYLSIKLTNKTSVNYVIDTLTFHIGVGVKKDLFKEEINPYRIAGAGSIKPHSNDYVYAALPLVALRNDERLTIVLREKKGSRNLYLFVPSEAILKAENY